MRRNDRAVDDPGQIRELLQTALHGQLSFAGGEEPYIVTMNYGIDGGDPLRLYFHCASEGRKLEAMERLSRVCFHAVAESRIETGPEACDWTCRYSSVTAFGRLRKVSDPGEKRRGLDTVMNHYGWTGATDYPEAMLKRTTVLCLDVDSIRGKSSL